jgi:hypothetical protein
MTRISLARAAGLASIAPALLIAAASAPAQEWTADASVGRIAQPSLPGALGSTGAALGLRYEGPRWLYLTAGMPFDSAGPAWGALGAGARFSRPWRGIEAGIDADAHGFVYRDAIARANGGGATLEAMPLVAGERGPVRVELRSGLQHHTSSFDGETDSRTLHASDLRASAGTDAFRATAEGRYVRAPEGGYPYAGAGFEAARGPGSAWAYAGKWLSDAIDDPVWGAGARLRVRGRTDVYASVQQETNDPLFRNPPRRSWSIGVSRRLGRLAPAPPAVAGPELKLGGVTFRVPLSAAGAAPSLAGDFNGWQPVPMVRQGGAWVLTLPLGRGVYRYAYRGADGQWFVPEGTPGRVDDGFGGFSSVLVVP